MHESGVNPEAAGARAGTDPSATLWRRTKAVAGEALELSGTRRDAFVEAACAGDAVLLSEVRALLHASATSPETLGEQGIPADVLADAVHAPAVTVGAMVGRYRIERPVGSGGMGAVFEATDTTLGRRVALKLLTLGLASTGARRRFEGEAAALARLDHPGIARVYEAGVHQAMGQAVSVPYFAMEFVEDARTLDVYVREERLGWRAVLDLFARVCDAVHHGHQKSVLHRDLKPSNILVQRSGQPRVIDFGVARLLDIGGATQGTRAGDLFGTPAYLPPEVFERGVQAMDTRGDVYSLGVVLYEILAGRSPFGTPGLTPVQMGKIVNTKVPAALGSVREDCKGDIETIVATAMAREPEHRYASVEQFGADLRRVLAYEPILARPTPLLRQASLFARRNRGLMAGAAVVTLGIAVGVVGLSVGLAHARESERRAHADAERAKRVSTFVMQMLRSASPFQGQRFRLQPTNRPSMFEENRAWPSAATPGRAPTVGDLLFAATGHLEEAFPNDPALRADMAWALAEAGNQISDPRIPEFAARAESLLSHAYGLDDPRTLVARQYVYASEIINGSTARFADIERDLTTIRALPVGANEELLQRAWWHYVVCLRTQGREQDAISLLRELREDVDRSYAGDSTYKIGLDLAIVRAQATDEHATDALAAMPGLLARARALPGDVAEDAELAVLFDMQFHQANAGQYDAAMHTLAAGAAISTRRFGGMDQGTYEWWNNMYFIALVTQEYDFAEYAAREQLRGAEAMLGPHSLYTTKACGRVARTLLSRNVNLDEAERMARRAIEGSPDLLAIGDGWALYHELLWAWSVRLQGDPERARQIIRHRMEVETAAGRPNAVNWVELVRCTELAQCEMDFGDRRGDSADRAQLIGSLIRDGECYGEELGREWPSVRLIEAARARFDERLSGR